MNNKLLLSALVFCLSTQTPYAFAEEEAPPRVTAAEEAEAPSSSGGSTAVTTATATEGMGVETPLTLKENLAVIANDVKACADPALNTAYINTQKSIATVLSGQKGCTGNHSGAAIACSEQNPTLMALIPTIQLLSAGVSTVTNSCSTFGKVMDATNVALTGYIVLCTARKALCASSCAKAEAGIEQLGADLVKLNGTFMPAAQAAYQAVQSEITTTGAVTPATEARNAACAKITSGGPGVIEKMMAQVKAELAEGTPGARVIAAKKKKCAVDYTALSANAVTSILSIAKSAQQSKNCKDKSSDVAVVDPCTVAATADTPTCICKNNPRASGCDNGLVPSNALIPNIPTSNGGNGGADINLAGLTGGPDGLNRAPSSAGGPGGPPPSEGGSGGDGLSGGGGSSDKRAEIGNTKTNGSASVLAGFGGGGGGGSFGGGYGGANDKYGQYLPGGAKDPKAAAAAAEAWKKEVTGASGKTNFEKVTDRYRDNSSSLMSK